MADARKLQRTVSFWRFVQAKDSAPFNEQIDWPAFMSKVAERARKERSRHDIEGTPITGSVYTRDTTDHLVLTKNRDDMPRQQNMRTGAVEPMATKAHGWVVVESSFIKFLDFGNAFGFLQSQVTAPSPQAVAKWINATDILAESVSAEPVVDPKRWKLLRDAGGVTMLEFAGPSAVFDRPITGPLDKLVGPAKFGGVKISVKIRASSRRTADDTAVRRDLYEAAEALASQVGVANLDTARVRVFDEDDHGIAAETINLLKQRFTLRRNIQLTSGIGASVTEMSAFSAILDTLSRFEPDLRAALRQDALE